MAQRPHRQAAGAAALEEAVGLAFRVLKVVMAILVVLFAGSGLETIEANEVGFVRRLGVLDTTPLEPGPHWSWPVIDEVEHIDRRAERHIVGTFDLTLTKAEQLAGGKAPTREGGLDPTRDGSLLTGDANILHMTLAARVKVSEPSHRAFVELGREDEVKAVVAVLLERAIVQAAAHRTVGSLLGAGKADYLEDVRNTLQRSITGGDLGLVVEGIDLERDINPSPQVRADFDAVEKSRQKVDQNRSVAESLATQGVSEAHLAAERRVSRARSEADRIVATAIADAERFKALLGEWKTQRRTLQERLLTVALVRGSSEVGEVFFVTDGELRIRIERDVSGIDREIQTKAAERQR